MSSDIDSFQVFDRQCSCGRKSSVDASTQTSQELLYLTLLELVEKGKLSGELVLDQVEFAASNRRSISGHSQEVCSTDWCQMGRELRQIADELHRTSSTPQIRVPQLNSDQEVQMQSSNLLSLCTKMFASPKPSRRRSLPDGSKYFSRPPSLF